MPHRPLSPLSSDEEPYPHHHTSSSQRRPPLRPQPHSLPHHQTKPYSYTEGLSSLRPPPPESFYHRANSYAGSVSGSLYDEDQISPLTRPGMQRQGPSNGYMNGAADERARYLPTGAVPESASAYATHAAHASSSPVGGYGYGGNGSGGGSGRPHFERHGSSNISARSREYERDEYRDRDNRDPYPDRESRRRGLSPHSSSSHSLHSHSHSNSRSNSHSLSRSKSHNSRHRHADGYTDEDLSDWEIEREMARERKIMDEKRKKKEEKKGHGHTKHHGGQLDKIDIALGLGVGGLVVAAMAGGK